MKEMEARKIKFRAWDKDRKELVCSGFYIRPDKGWCLVDRVSGDEVLVDRVNYELMQFTGLLDKNGKEIYEGDIVKRINGYYDWDETEVIEFYDGIIANGCSPFIEISMSGWQCAKGEDCEIIGNIYENPEFLSKLTNK